MRRKDREVTDQNAIEQFIAEAQIIRIGFYDNGEIYIVPVNYGYVFENDHYTFYFHGAKAGRKYELTKASPTVGFEIDGNYALSGGDAACDYTAAFQSVIGTGVLTLVEEKAEKIAGLECLMKQTTGRTGWDYSPEMLDATAIFRLDAEKISCKAKCI